MLKVDYFFKTMDEEEAQGTGYLELDASYFDGGTLKKKITNDVRWNHFPASEVEIKLVSVTQINDVENWKILLLFAGLVFVTGTTSAVVYTVIMKILG